MKTSKIGAYTATFLCLILTFTLVGCSGTTHSQETGPVYLNYRDKALICAMAWQSQTGDLVRIVVGPCGDEDPCEHIQAQALIDNEWAFLDLYEGEVITTGQDYWFEVGDFLCLAYYLEDWYSEALRDSLCGYLHRNLIPWSPET